MVSPESSTLRGILFLTGPNVGGAPGFKQLPLDAHPLAVEV
jgi:hypothetical protein